MKIYSIYLINPILVQPSPWDREWMTKLHVHICGYPGRAKLVFKVCTVVFLLWFVLYSNWYSIFFVGFQWWPWMWAVIFLWKLLKILCLYVRRNLQICWTDVNPVPLYWDWGSWFSPVPRGVLSYFEPSIVGELISFDLCLTFEYPNSLIKLNWRPLNFDLIIFKRLLCFINHAL